MRLFALNSKMLTVIVKGRQELSCPVSNAIFTLQRGKKMDILIILKLIGGLVLFLYGIQFLGDCLKRVSGGKLEQILETLTSNKWKGALLGMIVTAVIQSSGATIVMCVGFVNSGIMSLSQSVGVILGANVGTTITAWLLSLSGITSDNLVLQMFKPENFAPLIGLIGLLMFMGGKKVRTKDSGSILLAFAILLIGMSTMSSAMSPLADDPNFTGMLTMFANPFLGLLAGLLMTAILQSSSASIGILQAIATSGTMAMGTAIPIIMGENIGSAITGVISSLGASRNAKRTAWIQMTFCILKTGIFMVAFYGANAVVHFAIMDEIATPVSIALFHSIFNIAAVIIMLPFSELLVIIVNKIFPETEDELKELESRHTFDALDERFLSSPGYALAQSKTVLLKMGAHASDAMNYAMDLIFEYDETKAAEVHRLESLNDEYQDQLDSYLTKLAGADLTEKESRLLSMLLHSTNDLERISDHARNIVYCVERMQEGGMHFSEAAITELTIFTKAVREILGLTMQAVTDNNMSLAKAVDPLQDTIGSLNLELKEHHAKRLQSGVCTVEMGIVLSDLTVDLERVADHCSNIAVYMLSSEEEDFDVHEYSHWEREASNTSFQLLENGFHAKYRLPKYKDPKKEKPADDLNINVSASTVYTPDPMIAAAAAEEEKEKKKKEKKKKKKLQEKGLYKKKKVKADKES